METRNSPFWNQIVVNNMKWPAGSTVRISCSSLCKADHIFELPQKLLSMFLIYLGKLKPGVSLLAF